MHHHNIPPAPDMDATSISVKEVDGIEVKLTGCGSKTPVHLKLDLGSYTRTSFRVPSTYRDKKQD